MRMISCVDLRFFKKRKLHVRIIRFRWKKWGTTWEQPVWRLPKNTFRILPTQPAVVRSISIPCKRSWRFDRSIVPFCSFRMVCKLLLHEHPAVLCSTRRAESRWNRRSPSRTSDPRERKRKRASHCLILVRLQNLSLFRCSIRITIEREKKERMKNLPRTKYTASNV